jgi:oxygen-independent coproporphyrinogen-3 oxidase
MAESPVQPITSLYVHVPFCAQKCSYCAFYSEASSGELINRYVSALIRELELIVHDLKPATVFFGGGTPSILNLRQWEQILRAMERLNLLGATEWTVECNPATVSLDKAKLLRSFGVNRISMGVQSLDEDLLDRLGRIHSREMVFKSFDILRKAGFDNLNLDLMFAIPGQTLEIWRRTLIEALAMQSEHLSSYEVIYEEDTPLFAQLQAGEFDVNEDLACAMYEELVSHATQAGFHQYEIANFARDREQLASEDGARPSPGAAGYSSPDVSKQSFAGPDANVAEPGDGRTPVAVSRCSSCNSTRHPTLDTPALACRHNINYWRGGSFYGLGPSATSYVRGIRTKNWSNTQFYCNQLEKGQRAIESREELPPLARAGETAAFGLRMIAGWPFEQFRQTTGYDFRKEWPGEMKRLVQQGWAQIEADRFQLTPEGLRFADTAAEVFLR